MIDKVDAIYEKIEAVDFYSLTQAQAQQLYKEASLYIQQDAFLPHYLSKKVRQWEITNDTVLFDV